MVAYMDDNDQRKLDDELYSLFINLSLTHMCHINFCSV